VTAIAGGRVDATINNMAGQVVPAMRGAAEIFCLVFDGGFQLDADPVAIGAKTCPVTAGTDTAETTGHRLVIIGEIQAVIEFIVGNLGFLHVMAAGALAKIFARFCRVPRRWGIPALNRCTGSQK